MQASIYANAYIQKDSQTGRKSVEWIGGQRERRTGKKERGKDTRKDEKTNWHYFASNSLVCKWAGHPEAYNMHRA